MPKKGIKETLKVADAMPGMKGSKQTPMKMMTGKKRKVATPTS